MFLCSYHTKFIRCLFQGELINKARHYILFIDLCHLKYVLFVNFQIIERYFNETKPTNSWQNLVLQEIWKVDREGEVK